MTLDELCKALDELGLDFELRHEFDGSVLISFDIEDESNDE
jgi:hypothetical protein